MNEIQQEAYYEGVRAKFEGADINAVIKVQKQSALSTGKKAGMIKL